MPLLFRLVSSWEIVSYHLRDFRYAFTVEMQGIGITSRINS